MKKLLLELITEPIDIDVVSAAYGDIKNAFVVASKSFEINYSNIVINLFQNRITVLADLNGGNELEDVLEQMLPSFIKSIEMDESIRWNTGDLTFYKPILNILCMLDDRVIDFSVQGIRTCNYTFANSLDKIFIADASSYCDNISEYIIFNKLDRIEKLRSVIKKTAASLGKKSVVGWDKLDKLSYSVCNPIAIDVIYNVGELSIPDSIVLGLLNKRENVIPLFDETGKLSDTFIVISESRKNIDFIRKGYKQTISDELRGIEYLLNEDTKQKLEGFIPRLNWIAEFERIGNLYDKTVRMEKLVAKIADDLDLADEMIENLKTASRYMKSDLATRTVKRYPFLKGEIANEMLKQEGINPVVAVGIKEQYYPDSDGNLPSSVIGTVLAVCDRFDDLSGLAVLGDLDKEIVFVRKKMDESILLMANGKPDFRVKDLIDNCLYIYTEESISAFDYNKVFNKLRAMLIRRLKVYLRKLEIDSVLIDDCFMGEELKIKRTVENLRAINEIIDESSRNCIGKLLSIVEAVGDSKVDNEGEQGAAESEFENCLRNISPSIGKADVICELTKHEDIIEELLKYYSDREKITNHSVRLAKMIREMLQ